ncbi:universal stress protein [Mycobacterium sp. SMC-4]|uniref:universal stress protein n=1 Tax=Mycobacterium sp. SMC-4 TaxID=2857059 RepID=UPI0021B3A0B0|nr:universal stress protein [Mycobacterium sp. SMC-4]UXA19392.1 universal stress protein [Mycobacterium sp. SMC-4]
MSVAAIVGYDGSPASNATVEAGAALFPGARSWITHLWTPPFASPTVRARLWPLAHDVNELIKMVEREGEVEAQRLVAMGVTLARAAGWDAEPLLRQTWGSEGLRIAQAAKEMHADVVLVGSRGLGGAKAVLGSVSDMVAHYSELPVIVVRYPMLAAEYAALPDGPVVVGWDGSAGAEKAFAAATQLFPERTVLLVSVDGDDVSPPSVDLPVAGDREVVVLTAERGRGFAGRAISNALVAVATDHNAAVVVVGSRGRSAAREILLGSVAMGTLHQSHRPVMVVPSLSPPR